MLHKRIHHNEKPMHHIKELPVTATRREPACSNKDPVQLKINKILKNKKTLVGSSLVVHWLGRHAFMAKDLGSGLPSVAKKIKTEKTYCRRSSFLLALQK